MNIHILNRENNLPADKLYMVARKGEFPVTVSTGAGKEIFMQVIDDPAILSMVNRFAQDKSTNPTLELLVDQDHFSDNRDLPSEAYGWIQNLQNRDDGLWAQIEWTAEGAAAIKDKRYRFLSPVWDLSDCEKLGNRRLRPLRLDKAAVTNEPNIKGMAPLKNRNNALGQEQTKGVQLMDFKTTLLALIGAAPDLADDKIEPAVTAFKTEIQNRTTELVTVKNRVVELENKELESLVEKDLDTYKDRIVNRDEMKALLIKNREDGLKIILALAPPAPGQKAHNRTDGKTPDGTVESEAQKIANRKEEQTTLIARISTERGCTRAAAYDLARSQKPDLFV